MFFWDFFLTAISPVRSIWSFLFRPERKIVLWQKIFAFQFYYSSFLLSSVEVPFCYRMILEKIGSPRKVTIYEFRQKQVYHQKPLYYHHKKTTINFSRDLGQWFYSSDYLWTEFVVIQPLWCFYVLGSEKERFSGKKSQIIQKKLRWKSMEALIWRLSGANKQARVI